MRARKMDDGHIDSSPARSTGEDAGGLTFRWKAYYPVLPVSVVTLKSGRGALVKQLQFLITSFAALLSATLMGCTEGATPTAETITGADTPALEAKPPAPPKTVAELNGKHVSIRDFEHFINRAVQRVLIEGGVARDDLHV
jgi:hypothetical protein